MTNLIDDMSNKLENELRLKIAGIIFNHLYNNEHDYNGAADALMKELRSDLFRNNLRWIEYAKSPQTALMLGSNLDPNDDTVDWVKECNRLADSIIMKKIVKES